jgi:hypothetical protein
MNLGEFLGLILIVTAMLYVWAAASDYRTSKKRVQHLERKIEEHKNAEQRRKQQ